MTDGDGAAARTIKIDGLAIEFRDMQIGDADALLAFVRSVPRHDLMFLPTDITGIEGLNGWIDETLIGLSRVILAVGPNGILGFSSVVHSASPWTRHIAELRVVVGQAVRGSGLGRELIARAFRAATTVGVQRITAQMTFDQLSAIRIFRELGFSPLAVLPDQVIDQDDATFDLLIMHQDVESFEVTLSRLGD
ncbi:MAG: GNAT family N-acetyltransferase [Chloroflexi bacterium]|nr:GNAT family N-acetyltransferase [Chloroflexota bacterium]MDA1147883.1 GNAT family N-acetyltransferase [Chloroflexota bacterium]